MKDFYSVADVRNADGAAEHDYGIPSALLMENAAAHATARIMLRAPRGGSVVLLAGGGNNGGDAFASARQLLSEGRCVAVFKTAEDASYKNDAAMNLAILKRFEYVQIYDADKCQPAFIKAALDKADCIGDALLGTGSHGAPRGKIAELIELLSGYDNIISFDIPSGIDPESGGVFSPCVKASETITFLAPKTGMGLFPAAAMCGEIHIGSIGVPPRNILPAEPELSLWDEGGLPSLLPAIPQDIHKTARGALLIFSGSSEYRGAPLLCARGALRAGSGVVYLAVPDFIAPYASEKLPEAIVIALPTKAGNVMPQESAELFAAYMDKCGAAAIGPGCGREEGCGEIFGWFWKSWQKKLIIDADMLYFLALKKDSLKMRDNVLITPHSGEAANILGISPQEVDSSRMASVRSLAETAGTALLKGRRTLIASRGKTTVCASAAGAPSLAVPGSGDVLTGAAGALASAGLPLEQAALAAAVSHGAAGEKLFKKYGPRGSLASEIADELPYFLR